VRDRVVVVVGGVMPIRGNGKAAYKAKDHSRDVSNEEYSSTALKIFENWRLNSRAMESRMR